MEEKKVVEVIENEEKEKVEAKSTFGQQVNQFVRRHGKKIAIGLLALAGIGIAYNSGKNASDSEDETSDEISEEE